jgi:hypothetical protein
MIWECNVPNDLNDDAALCYFERSCAEFHVAQAEVAVLANENENVEYSAIEQKLARRDEALMKIRALPAQTGSAWEAKADVLDVMADWLAAEDVTVATFALEMVAEARALLQKESTHTDACIAPPSAPQFVSLMHTHGCGMEQGTVCKRMEKTGCFLRRSRPCVP